MNIRLLRSASRTASLLVVVAGIGCGACGPSVDEDTPLELPSEDGRRYAEALCRAIETCGCAQPFDSMADCEAEYHARFDKLLEAKFEVDPGCFDAWIENINADPCHAETPPPGEPFPCASLRGAKERGDSCEAHLGLIPLGVDVWPLRADECGEGLSCLYAVCSETPGTNDSNPGWNDLAEGEACGPTYLVGFCPTRSKLYCDATERVCRVRKPLGAECSPGECEWCTEGGGPPLYCQGATETSSGTCAQMPPIGEPCDPLDTVVCGSCSDVGWCDPATSTCTEGRAPRLCSQIAAPGL